MSTEDWGNDPMESTFADVLNGFTRNGGRPRRGMPEPEVQQPEHRPAHEAFGGPIHARLEGVRFRSCGREGPPITFLDLGAADRDAEFVWSANMAVRRRALERIGTFDAGPDIYGDELGEDLMNQFRLTAVNQTPRLIEMMADPHNPWFDDKGTPGKVETRDDIVLRALRDAVALLSQRLGADMRFGKRRVDGDVEAPHFLLQLP